MDDETKKLIEETAALAKENNAMLHKLRSSQKNARAWKGIYWVVIIGLTYAAYIEIKPYLEQTKAMYESAQQQVESIKNLGNSFKGQ